jgi:hypothetical protein
MYRCVSRDTSELWAFCLYQRRRRRRRSREAGLTQLIESGYCGERKSHYIRYFSATTGAPVIASEKGFMCERSIPRAGIGVTNSAKWASFVADVVMKNHCD